MKTYQHLTTLGKAVSTALLGSGILVSASAQAAVSQAPLSLTEGVAPNMIFTLDDSSSMAWSYVPDKQPWDDKNWDTSSRRFRAANTNPMYYNPHVIYDIPPNFDSNGKETKFSVSFSNAPVNGFKPAGTKKNLGSDYKVVYEFEVPLGNVLEVAHPALKEQCTVNIGTNNNTGSCTINGRSISVRRTSSSCDSVNPSKVTNYNIDGKSFSASYTCGRSGNTVTITATVDLSNIPAHYYEYDANQAGCVGSKDDRDGGGEACYRLRWVTDTSAYDENGNRLKYVSGEYVNGKDNFAIWYSFYKKPRLGYLVGCRFGFLLA